MGNASVDETIDTLRLRVLTHYERSAAATGDNNVFCYSYVKSLYLTHYKRSRASGDERSE